MAAIATRHVVSPVMVEMSGGKLLVEWSPGGAIRMRGPATLAFEGEIDLEKLR